MVATNFSAFTVFGTSGAGYRDGYAFFPIMGFGTGFMAVTFWIIGRKIWKAGQEHNAVTPPEMIRAVYKNPALSFVFAVVMIVFTIPYLAVPVVAAAFVSYLLTQAMLSVRTGSLSIQKPSWLGNPFVYLMAAIFLLAMDFWAWDKIRPTLAGIPFWWVYFVVLSGLQTVLMGVMIRREKRRHPV